MLREQTAEGAQGPTSSEVCVSCGAAELDARCNACGAALRAGDYKILKLISQTAHSRVYLAQSADGKKVALKELLFSLVPTLQQLEAFEREAEVLSGLSHPAIPKILGAFKTGQGPHTRLYLAVEFIEGETLEAALKRGPLPEKDVREICRAVLQVLVYLHGRTPPVLHRDLKPANLIRRADGSIAVVDFGSAREVARGQTHSATLVGTIGYMPLEQLGGTVGPRSDLYALGATAVHLLTGVSPADTFNADGSIKLDGNPMRRFLSAMVAARANDRFLTAQAALEALDEPAPAGQHGRVQVAPEVAAREGDRQARRDARREARAQRTPRQKRVGWVIAGLFIAAAVMFSRAKSGSAVPARQSIEANGNRTWQVKRTFTNGALDFKIDKVSQQASWSRPGDSWIGVELEVAKAPEGVSSLDWSTLVRMRTEAGVVSPTTVGDSPNSSTAPVTVTPGRSQKLKLNFFVPSRTRLRGLELADGTFVPLSDQ